MTADEETQLRASITRAERAYEDLMLGSAVKAFTDQNGERVEYSTANKGNLYAYIQSLKAQLPNATVRSFTPPLRFLF